MLKSLWQFYTAGRKFQNTLAKTIAYLPVGNLYVLKRYQETFLPYKSDLDAQGRYDKTQEYNGAELTIMLKGGDCESLAAFFSEIIRAWLGWESWHVMFVFIDDSDGEYKAHDVAFFKRPNGTVGWIDGWAESNFLHEGGYEAFVPFYATWGWYVEGWWLVNDMGEKLQQG